MHAPRDPAVDLLPRTIRRSTSLQRDVAIIFPAADPAYRALAEKIAAALTARGGAAPECVTDLALMPERSTPLPAAYRARPLIVLGSLNTNRTLQPLYADYLCSTDATYPGGDGYDLRTVVNPYGTGANLILAGGSSLAGVARAVEKLLAAIAAAPALTLPFLLEVELAPQLATDLAAWPYTPLFDSAELQLSRNRGMLFFTEPIRVIGAYTLMWSWTGDARYAHIARDTLRTLNERMTDGYGDWHYLAERFMRAVPLLVAGGFLNDADIARTDHLLLLTALGNQDEWWRMRVGEPPLGHRHQGKGTYEFLLLARYLRDQASPTPALRALCDRWIGECCTFLDYLAAARGDDQDDESSLNNIATVFRYALGQERHAFFTSGNARFVAERCLALHDNHGSGAGQGGYGESQGMYLQQEATVQTAASAFYYGDGRLKWILQKLPNLAVAQRYSFLHYIPVFLQKFDTGPELAPVPPAAERSVQVLPITDHQFRISGQPPEHIEFSGHMVNAPETWQLPEAVGLNELPQDRGFDKLVLRAGYDRRDAYLMIQGFQGGFRWQGHMQAANAIVRFFQAGHVWLVQNTSRHSYHDKNGLFISDGRNDTPLSPIAEYVASADFAPVALTVTRLPDYHHTAWTRHVFWSKAGEGCFVVIDRVAFAADGPHSLTCSWRTPGHAALTGRRWQADQGTHRFTLIAGDHVPATSDEEFDQGACAPYVLRQRRAGTHRTGDETSFQNLFHVRAQDAAETLDLQRLDDRSALIFRNGAPQAWCAAGLEQKFKWLGGASASAVSAWTDPQSVVFAGATEIAFVSVGWRLRSAAPVSALFNLSAATLTVRLDAPGLGKTTATFRLGAQVQELALSGTEAVVLPLPAPDCTALSHAIGVWLGALIPSLTPPVAQTAPADHGWISAWIFDGGARVPERIRKVCVTADPLPIDHSPDQLLDPVMPDGYSREIWRQWPVADEYRITLRFPDPQPVSALNILGDCIDDPSLRTFNPLPEGIVVEAETASGTRRACAVTRAPDRRYKRYRDAENRLEAHTGAVGEKVRAFHLRFPAASDGRPFVLHRLEVLGDRQLAPAVTHWTAADLDGDGVSEIAVINVLNELLVLDAAGRVRWRHTLPAPATHLSAQPLDANRPPVLCVGLLGGDVRLYHADGTPRAVLALAAAYAKLKDCLFGWYNAAHSLAVWHRDAAGRGSLVVGGYGIILFLDADGAIAGHSFVDGPWAYDILVAPETRADRGDVYVRCGWNHGVLYYKGVSGPGPSGHRHSFGGFMQPMFRELRRVIPFLNGRSLAAAWVEVPSCPEGALFAATELGCGVLSTAKSDWLWKLEGGMSLNACALGRLDGQPVAFTAGADGFVTVVNLADGRVLHSHHAGAPVIGVSQTAAGDLLIATRTGVQRLDPTWQLRGTLARPLRRVLSFNDHALLVLRDDHTLELLQTN
ncbi:MAG: hypothetical protein JSS11_02535 [Verrucomicrobia bacterium]|nr:hypothetical protein [Verrucomicrobiota bacterium]